MAKERYPGRAGRSEYGGGDGTPQRLPDGGSLDLPGIAAATGQRARLLRTAGLNDYNSGRKDLVGAADTGLDLSSMSDAQRAAYEADLQLSLERAAERERLRDKTNGYIDEPDQYSGDSVS